MNTLQLEGHMCHQGQMEDWLPFNQEGTFLWLNIRTAVLPSIQSQGLFISGFQNEEWESVTCADFKWLCSCSLSSFQSLPLYPLEVITQK